MRVRTFRSSSFQSPCRAKKSEYIRVYILTVFMEYWVLFIDALGSSGRTRCPRRLSGGGAETRLTRIPHSHSRLTKQSHQLRRQSSSTSSLAIDDTAVQQMRRRFNHAAHIHFAGQAVILTQRSRLGYGFQVRHVCYLHR